MGAVFWCGSGEKEAITHTQFVIARDGEEKEMGGGMEHGTLESRILHISKQEREEYVFTTNHLWDTGTFQSPKTIGWTVIVNADKESSRKRHVHFPIHTLFQCVHPHAKEHTASA